MPQEHRTRTGSGITKPVQGPAVTRAEGDIETLLSDALAIFVEEQRSDTIPDKVRHRAKLLMLDAIGIAYASTRFEFARKALNGLSDLGSGDADVIGMPVQLGVRDAVLMNGILVHGLDYDDTFLPGSVHLTASCVPTALGVAAKMQSSGREFLTACILGLEVGARLAGAGKGGFLRAGFQATGLVGTFACTLLAGRLMQLSRSQLFMAQGIALSMAAGNMQPVLEGSWTKRMHPGWAGSCGITAASMARNGFMGPSATYEGPAGLFPCFLREHLADSDLSIVTANLGRQWEFPRASIKLFPACHQSHAFMNAAIELRRDHAVCVKEIDSICALVPEVAVPLICEPIAAKRRPNSGYAAQFSLPYAIACCLRRGRFGLAEIEESSYSDPELLDLARKVSYEIDPNAGYPKSRTGEVVLRLKNGQAISRRAEILPDEPATEGDIVAKFMQNAECVVSPLLARQIQDMIMDIDHVSNARRISHALGGRLDLPQ